jgi:hypothetical protein
VKAEYMKQDLISYKIEEADPIALAEAVEGTGKLLSRLHREIFFSLGWFYRRTLRRCLHRPEIRAHVQTETREEMGPSQPS